MSIQNEIDRISTAVQNAHLKVIEKGGTSAAPYLVANLAQAIDTIPEATEPKLQEKSVVPTAEGQVVTPDEGYDGLSRVSLTRLMPGRIGPTTMNVSSTGLVQATPSVASSGYFEAGPLSPATLQLTTKAAQTITPGTADKTIASGRYLTGTQTIKGDSNLKESNIKSGVSIFGVAGSLTAGEDVTAETETYTDLLTDLEAAVDALPDAGSGGSVETCSVELVHDGTYSEPRLTTIQLTCYTPADGFYAVDTGLYLDTSAPIENVVCGSVISVMLTSQSIHLTGVTNGTIIASYYTDTFYAVQVDAAAGETVTLYGYDRSK